MTTQNKRSFMTAIEKTYGRQLRRFLSARLRGASADIPDLVQNGFGAGGDIVTFMDVCTVNGDGWVGSLCIRERWCRTWFIGHSR